MNCPCTGCRNGKRCISRKRTKLCTNRVKTQWGSYPCGSSGDCEECKHHKDLKREYARGWDTGYKYRDDVERDRRFL